MAGKSNSTSPSGPHTTDPDPLTFLTLPLEIRFKIYEYLLYPAYCPDKQVRREIRLGPGQSVKRGRGRYRKYTYDLVGLRKSKSPSPCRKHHPDSIIGSDTSELSPSSEEKHSDLECDLDDESDDESSFFRRRLRRRLQKKLDVEPKQEHAEGNGEQLSNHRERYGTIMSRDQPSSLTKFFLEEDFYAAKCYKAAAGWDIQLRGCGIDPGILRVNQQIFSEAIAYLYRNVACQVKLQQGLTWCHVEQRYIGSPQSRTQNHNELSRVDAQGHLIYPIMQSWICSMKGFIPVDQLLNLGCLWWMRHIRIDISWAEVFGRHYRLGRGTRYPAEAPKVFQNMGKLLIQILRHVSEEPLAQNTIPKRLEVVSKDEPLQSLISRPIDSVEIVPDTEVIGISEGLKEIITLLKSMRSRLVTVCDTVLSESGDRCVEREVDLESFAWLTG